MKCNYCGELLPNDAKFCPSCGHKIIVERNHCPQCGTMMPEDALFCPNCGNSVSSVDDGPKVRDYYYTDGTWSTVRDESKTVAGIVVNTKTTEIERSHGWTHGQIIATQSANIDKIEVSYKEKYGFLNMRERMVTKLTDKLKWGTDRMLPSPHKCFFYKDNVKKLLDDRDGYLYTNSGHTIGDEFEIFNAVRKFPVSLPKGKTSGWYVPAIGQLIDVVENIAGVSVKWKDNGYLDILVKSADTKEFYDVSLYFFTALGYRFPWPIASSSSYHHDGGCGICLDFVNLNLDGKEELWINLSNKKNIRCFTVFPMAAF